jgi:hypothetical protein
MDNPGFDEQDSSPSYSPSKSKLEEEKNNNEEIENGQNEKERKHEKKMILKNIVIISFAFMLLFTAFQSMASLQSSINKVKSFSLKLYKCPQKSKNMFNVH